MKLTTLGINLGIAENLELTPILEVWNFGDPKATMEAFETLERQAEVSGNAVYRAELVTQIARRDRRLRARGTGSWAFRHGSV